MSELDLAPIKKRALRATKGEWVGDPENHLVHRSACDFGLIAEVYRGENDTEFIAHAKTDIPALIAEVERLRVEVEYQTNTGNAHARFSEKRRNQIDELREQNAQLKSQIERVREVLEGQPKCDKYADGEAISCGWKHSIRAIEKILEEEK